MTRHPQPDTIQPTSMRNATLLLLSTLTIMSGTVVSASLPGLVDHFKETPDVTFLAQLVITIPAISIVLGAPLAGIVTDKLGRRTLLLLSVLVYGIAGAGGLCLDSMTGLLISRAVLGLSVAGIMVNTTTLAGDYFEGHARTRFMGHRSVAISSGGIVFLVLGGILANWGWRVPFTIYLMALVFLPMAMRWLNEPDMGKLAPAGALPSHGIWQEHRRHIFLYMAGLFHFVAFYFVFLHMPFRLKEIGMPSPALMGVVLGSVTAASAAASALYPKVERHLRGNLPFALAFSLVASGYLLVSVSTGLAGVFIAMALTGAGTGVMLPNLTAKAVSEATPHMRGRVAGVMTASVFMGQFLSPIFTHPIVAAFGGQATFVVLAALYGVMVAGILWSHKR